ncbi:Protein of unknown function [Filimonas lacunae]|uniref:DUF1572 domain-containing protein n=1 Tax=Filimonas lacunae TaxID=477680 RepID=A0A173MM62_9BACT|nr:DUF1572 family protein [Filimonas lacunae]BAV08559.1 hypothetical protein FLA_4605 [Filimonas lacunae]SIS57122.1 Protein of unknown function [Filimonas lacunae]
MEATFLKDVIKRFKNYKELGDKTLAQLNDKDLFFRPSPASNSIALIIQHMYGNMMSRWTNFLTEDGEKHWRSRDKEFEEMTDSKADVIAFWNGGWECLITTLESLQPEDLDKTIYIRTEPLTAYDAILRQLAHYPYHVGQIITIARMLRDDNWQSLSIAKGESDAFNKNMGMQ